ncbi:MAG: hypothetical protein IJX68_06980 [Rikenellaceae bacterium]|nr:hypothetical protein [Rikenellaceae bacterium]
MSTLNRIDRRLPYHTSDADFEVMAERIRLRTTARVEATAPSTSSVQSARRPALRMAIVMALVAVAIVTGAWFATSEPEPQPTLAELLATASPETLREVAATNYDDIIFNQQI